MAYMSAREMLSGLPVKMAEGGPVTYNQETAADILAAEEAYLANPSAWTPETAYAAIIESGISLDEARAAGVAETTIDAIFTTAAPLAGDQLSSEGQASFMDSGSGFANAITQENVDAYIALIMEDGKVDAAERRATQDIATREGVTYQDMIDFGVDPNILYRLTPCPEGYTRNAEGTCVLTPCPEGYTRNAEGTCVLNACPEGYTRNAEGTCVLNACPEGYTRNAEGTCVLNACPEGYTRNAEGACVEEIFVNTQEDYVTPTVYQPLPDNTSVYAAGEESLDTTFRESAPRTEVLDANGNLTNFDYTPAASLRSATGSGYNWTPPTVTSRPRSLMGADLLARYTGGRAAADLRQLTTGLGNGRTYSDYTGVLQNPGSYGGGLSKSQLYSRMRGLDYQRDNAAAGGSTAAAARGGISAYLAANPDIAASYESQSGQLGGQSLEQFARNHYNTTGRAEMAAGTRGLFTLVESTGGQEDATGYINEGGGYEGEGDNYGATNWNQRYDMGKAGGVTRPFAHGGSVKKPQGFADGGTASANLKALDPSDSLFITTDPVVEDDSDNVQRDIPLMEWDGVERPTPMQTESQTLLENIVAGYPKAINSVGNYFVRPDEQGNPSMVDPRQVGSDVASLGGALVDAVKEDDSFLKSRSIAEIAPITGELISGADALKFSNMANEARASGDDSAAGLYEQLVTLSAAGAVPLLGMGARIGRRATIKAVEEAIKKGALGDAAKMLEEIDAIDAWHGGPAVSGNKVRSSLRNIGDAQFTPSPETNAFKSRETATVMTPDDFLNLAEELPESQVRLDSEAFIRDQIAKGEPLETPFLTFSLDDKGVATVNGHEGRHRARVLKEMGVTEMPVRLRSEGTNQIRWSEQDNASNWDRIKVTWPSVLAPEKANPNSYEIAFPIADPLEVKAGGNRVRSALRDIGENAPTNPQTSIEQISQDIKSRYGLDSFTAYEKGDDVTLGMITVPKGKRKQGVGTAAMNDLIEYADTNNKRVKLTPDVKGSDQGTTSRKRLVDFYKRFGFVENKGRNKDFTVSEGMFRLPKSR